MMRYSTFPSRSARFVSAWLAFLIGITPFKSSFAGDILRRGSVAGPSRQAGPGNLSGGTANEVGASGRDALARTTQALQAVKAMQDAARNAALNGPNNLGRDPNHAGQQLPNVPNGLTSGGLQVAPKVPANLTSPGVGEDPTLWQGASLPTQTTTSGHADVTITQNKQQALLNWQTFNVGKGTKVTFDQTAGGENASQWIAFNKINDPSGVPSQILGSTVAIGQVYLINPNGILFGGSSQINLHTLVASSLPINDNLIARGLLNNPDNQFLFSGLSIAAGSNGTPAFTPVLPSTPNGQYGDVVVQAGAQISAPTTADHVGGRVALFGPNVTNSGAISTPDGQTILAAGLQIGLAAHSTNDPSLRGLDVYVGQVGTYAGTATNSGLLDDLRADVTLAGKEVDQLGIVNSSTSVSLNGRTELQANYDAVANEISSGGLPNPELPPFLFQKTGLVTLGPGSVTQILPELASTERVVGRQLALSSKINIAGENIHFAGDSILYAPSATVGVNAGLWDFYLAGGLLSNKFVYSAGQIYLDAGALIDVSGSANVQASVTENFVQAQLRGSELANFPVQRNGPLRGQTITIDIRQHGTFNGQPWVGTPLADVSGYVNLVQRPVGELTTAGGSVNLNAGSSVIAQAGSKVDVSSGWISYQGGIVHPTQLLSAGKIFDISQAVPDRIYNGLLSDFSTLHPKYGLIASFANPLPGGGRFEAGYIQGGNGGSLAVNAPGMALDGTLSGAGVAGPRQLTTPPTPSQLLLSFRAQNNEIPFFDFIYPTAPKITFSSDAASFPAAPFTLDGSGHAAPLALSRQQEVFLSPDLLGGTGFGSLTVDAKNGTIVLPTNVSLNASVGGSILFNAANIALDGSITAAGGILSFTAFNILPEQVTLSSRFPSGQLPLANPNRGNISIGSAASLSTAGIVVDSRTDLTGTQLAPYNTSGGSISLTGLNILFPSGSKADVSGGVFVNGNGDPSYGSAGTLVIRAGQDASLPYLLGGSLTLGGTVSGYSGGKGGTLNLAAPFVQVGGERPGPNTLFLSPDFFDQGGFTNFTVTGLGNSNDQTTPEVLIAPGTDLVPTAVSLVAQVGSVNQATQAISLLQILKPQGLRLPVNLSFNATGVSFNGSPIVRGDVELGAAASIMTDPGASVSFRGDTATIRGSIYAPGGLLNLTGANSSSLLFADNAHALVTVDIGPQSVLSTAGITLLTPDARGFRTGTVLPGGLISVSGNILAEAGSLLNVSGATDVLDLSPGFSGRGNAGALSGSTLIPTRVDSNAGSIIFRGGQELFVNSRLLGEAGGPAAAGGNLVISSGRFYADNRTPPTPVDVTLTVTQSNPMLLVPSANAVGATVLDAQGAILPGRGYFAADAFASSGLSSLTLAGTVQFAGPVSLTAARSLTLATGGFLFADSLVSLNAPYVAIGTAFRPPFDPQQPQTPFFVQNNPFYRAPSFGPGDLSVTAQLIDIGNLSLQGIGTASLNAVHGDIRGNGTFDMAGNLSLTAGQIYPPTEVSFTIAAYDFVLGGVTHPGSITIAGGDLRPLPLSAGGKLNLYSSLITQGGVLRAPIGQINLGWNGTGIGPVDLISNLTLPIAQEVRLSNGSVTSVSAIDPITGKATTIPYGLNLNGTAWIDPAGVDITAGGVPEKSIKVSGLSVLDQAGSLVDIRGGGDLSAYRFVPGVGGTQDVLASSNSFAVIPGYDTGYAPYAPFNNRALTSNLGTDPGFVNSSLSVGDQVYLNGGGGLASGIYTLLPARYATLPGAFLVTPKVTTPNGTLLQADGSSLVPGYRLSGFELTAAAPIFSSFEVAPPAVVAQRAHYDIFSANTYLKQAALQNNIAAPRLPIDSGQLLFDAARTMSIFGSLTSKALSGGRGGLVDISSPLDILIAGPGVTGTGAELVLDASALSNFGAESLLIGGIRHSTTDGTAVTVTTNNVTVDNAGTPLTGQDIILAANRGLTLAAGAVVEQVGTLATSADTLILGNPAVAGSGDGVLLRVSADPSASIARFGVDASTVPHETINANARLTGASVTLDSTYATSLDPSAVLFGSAINLNSGQISIQLPDGVITQPTNGLVLAGVALQDLAAVQSLSFLSYSSIDIYGTGVINASNSLQLHAGAIRGFNNGGTVEFSAKDITLDNAANAAAVGAIAGLKGDLVFDANTIQIGRNQLSIDQFSSATLHASGGILTQGIGGLATRGDLTLTTPLVTGALSSTQSITADGAVVLNSPGTSSIATVTGGLGPNLTISGASLTIDTNIGLTSGQLVLHATSGDLLIGNNSTSKLDLSGTAQTFFDLTNYTSGGQISLIADRGTVNLGGGGSISVAAPSGGGNAGTVSVSAPTGSFVFDGSLNGRGGAEGSNGSFTLDVGSRPALANINALLDRASFTQSRSFRVRTGDVLVDGIATSKSFSLSADQGSIDVTGTIDASGTTGGQISLSASGSVSLEAGSLLTVAGMNFDNAGKSGAISLEAGSEINGSIDPNARLRIAGPSATLSAARVDLSVASNKPGSAALGDFTGTLHLRAPQTPDGKDVRIDSIDGTIIGASNIVVEGYKLYDLTNSGGLISNAVRANILANGNTFVGAAGVASPSYSAMVNRLVGGNSSLRPLLIVEVGAELINRNGDLRLPNDWNLSSLRFGTSRAPGILTLRAAGNLDFQSGGLSDGFQSSNYNSRLLAPNSLLPVTAQSWSYRLVAGADLNAANFRSVQALQALGDDSGSLLLGSDAGPNIANPFGPDATINDAIAGHYQVIRTGSGDIDVAAARDVKFLNHFAGIFTTGTLVSDQTLQGTYDLPRLFADFDGALRLYPAQFTLAGGNVSVTAQADIIHQTRDGSGNLVTDSVKELPTNWLYRRGFVETSGKFGRTIFGDVASTSWWIDFSNFFEGVGALGGGNVTLAAGHDVSNVDAVIPTNARMPGKDAVTGVPITPSAAKLVELGGGDLTVRAGHDINGGVYYVERGQGSLTAESSILTNSTRSPSLNTITGEDPFPAQTWLPTTLFLGKGNYAISAKDDVLLGPIANPFLLPGGLNNSYWDKSYFSTYAATDTVTVTSLAGSVTMRESATLPTSGVGASVNILQAWYQNLLLIPDVPTASFFQPWLRLNETDVTPFATVSSLIPETLRIASFSRDVNLVGNVVLSPSPSGTLDLLAFKSVNALQPNGVTLLNGGATNNWGTSTINLSDADPNAIPGIASPFAYQSVVGSQPVLAETGQLLLSSIDALFTESGATTGTANVLQMKQKLHAAGGLHRDDLQPVHLYASHGDISGLTFFSPKVSRVISGQDITDVAFYLQNTNSQDVSVVASARNLVLYDANSALRIQARSPGNVLNILNGPLTGDLQISGPGTLEVLAGKNLDLGGGPSNSDGTGVGITSIGNARNPFLPFAGASIIVGAGIGPASDLANSSLDFNGFITKYLNPATGAGLSARYLPELAKLLGLDGAGADQTWAAFQQLPTEAQDQVALDVFYLVLRDAGRDRNDPASSSFGTFAEGSTAIYLLFPGHAWEGDVSLTAREIKTANGGDISIFAPGGQLTVGLNASGGQVADQGILTQRGGNISIFTKKDVNVGTSRIFTLRGGNEIIWSAEGSIASGASSKTVQAAPPTRVLIDPQSADVQTDLAGLATGGGIGVLASVAGARPSDVDLIAPTGTIDAGDAGIRVSGNLNIAAVQVLNAGNIQTGGSSTGTPVVAAPNLGGLTAASNSAGAQNAAAADTGAHPNNSDQDGLPSIITVEVLGYGGGDGDPDNTQDEEEKKRRRQQQQETPQGSQRPFERVVASSR